MQNRWERRERKQQAERSRIRKHGQMTPILNAIRKAARRAGMPPEAGVSGGPESTIRPG